jgi:glycosyltransferase involved in cell wall biosynthesis
MRVALLHYAAPPVVGGVEGVLAHQARLMTEAGHRVRVIAARGGAGSAAIEFMRLPQVDSRHPQVLAVKAQLDAGAVTPDFERLQEALAAELRGALADQDIVIAHNVCSLHKNLPLTAALQQLHAAPDAPRLILWHHDLAWTTPRYRAELHDGYPWDLLRTDWPDATQVTISRLRQRELAKLLGVPPNRINVIPNGVDVRAFLKLEDQTWEFVQRLKLLDAAPLLLLPVRLTPRKNIELALLTLRQLRATFPAATLIVTGPLGPHNPANVDYFAQLKQVRAEAGLTGAVHFLAELTEAYLPDAVIADFFRLADALLFPSREEGFGLPMLEAALSHLPIFCADSPGAPLRELGGAEATYFSPEADPASVANLIATQLTASPTFRFAARARRVFTWEHVYTQHIAPLLASQANPQPQEVQ